MWRRVRIGHPDDGRRVAVVRRLRSPLEECHRDHECCADDNDRGQRQYCSVTVDVRRRLADALVLIGGAALVASAFSHWVSSGYGSSLRGHALVDALIAV